MNKLIDNSVLINLLDIGAKLEINGQWFSLICINPELLYHAFDHANVIGLQTL